MATSREDRRRPRPVGRLSLAALLTALSIVRIRASEETVSSGRPQPTSLGTVGVAGTSNMKAASESNNGDNYDVPREDEQIDYGNHNTKWEDGPSSWEEFGHDNANCNMAHITVQEWEEGKYWTRGRPVIVTGVTEHWAARNNWKLDEMLRRYPDAEATMGDGRWVGEIGPDAAGNLLQAVSVKVRDWSGDSFVYQKIYCHCVIGHVV